MTLPPGLRVDADLRVQVDDIDARVVGAGHELTLTTDRPFRFLRAAAAGSAGAGPGVARQLERAGLTVTVRGPRGPVAVLGAGAGPSRLGLPPVRLAGASLAARLLAVGAVVAGVVLLARRRGWDARG